MEEVAFATVSSWTKLNHPKPKRRFHKANQSWLSNSSVSRPQKATKHIKSQVFIMVSYRTIYNYQYSNSLEFNQIGKSSPTTLWRSASYFESLNAISKHTPQPHCIFNSHYASIYMIYSFFFHIIFFIDLTATSPIISGLQDKLSLQILILNLYFVTIANHKAFLCSYSSIWRAFLKLSYK